MSDKLLAYTAPDGTTQAMIPNWGARPVKGVTIRFSPDAKVENIQRALRTLGSALNGSVSFDYAETEEKFIQRLAKKALPAKSKDQRLVTMAEWKAEKAARERDTAPTGPQARTPPNSAS